VAARAGDASDATADVVRTQAVAREPIAAAELAASATGSGPARLVRVGPDDVIDSAWLRPV
jgi:predicted kinase